MKPYNDYDSYLKNKYGCKVYRIALNAGFSCPNRDGTKGADGCIYCSDKGSAASYAKIGTGVREQLTSGIARYKDMVGTKKFIAYFQAFTNTYAPIDTLKSTYDAVLGLDRIVGISIATRPDAIDREKLKLISSYAPEYDVWMEYGLQSMNDRTLKAINRGHAFRSFVDAVEMTKKFGLPVCAHVILGLPGETNEDALKTAGAINCLGLDGIKIHLLHVLRNSRLEDLYNEGRVDLLEKNEYVELVCDFLERLDPKIIVQRLTGEGGRSDHIAPAWALNKIAVINEIGETLKKRGARQGSRF